MNYNLINKWILFNGKGTKYTQNNIIIYEGDFVDGLMEGNGKFIHENGDYYIGQFRNNLANGKGTEYDVFGVIIYEGDFVDDVRNGDGKLFYENVSYYIGGLKMEKEMEMEKNLIKMGKCCVL